jgi:endogenous inhibitor of DNA gyrase (YacG/DUF329 family)
MVLKFIPIEEAPELQKPVGTLYPLQTEAVCAGQRKHIFINCPNSGKPVSTGLKTESVVFESLPAVAVPLQCPECGKIHRWKPVDAWIGPKTA